MPNVGRALPPPLRCFRRRSHTAMADETADKVAQRVRAGGGKEIFWGVSTNMALLTELKDRVEDEEEDARD